MLERFQGRKYPLFYVHNNLELEKHDFYFMMIISDQAHFLTRQYVNKPNCIEDEEDLQIVHKNFYIHKASLFGMHYVQVV